MGVLMWSVPSECLSVLFMSKQYLIFLVHFCLITTAYWLLYFCSIMYTHVYVTKGTCVLCSVVGCVCWLLCVLCGMVCSISIVCVMLYMLFHIRYLVLMNILRACKKSQFT